MCVQRSDGNDVVINRMESATASGGKGDDKIFNFAKSGTVLNGGEGDDSIYSVGLSGGKIDTGDGSAERVNLIGDMTDGTIKMGTGTNTLDATGKNLKNTKITAGGSTTLTAASIAGGDGVVLGAGTNAVNAGKVADVIIKSSGDDTYTLGTVDRAKIDTSDAVAGKSSTVNITGSAKGTEFALGAGTNTINAAGKTLTSVTITDKAGATTDIAAKNISGTDAAKSSITLKGSDAAGAENNISISGAINHATIETGKGKGILSAGSVSNSAITMDTAGSKEQQAIITGAMTDSTLKTGKGNDVVNLGSVVRGTVDMSDGDNTFVVTKTSNGLSYTAGAGNDYVEVSGTTSNSSIDLGAGTNTFNAFLYNKKGDVVGGQTLSNTNISASGKTTIYAGAFRGGKDGNNITLGAGAHDVTLGSVSGNAANRIKINLGTAAAEDQKLTILGAASSMEYKGSKGLDQLMFQGGLSNSDVDMSTGKNELNAYRVNSKGAKVGQRISNTNIAADGQTTMHAGVFAGGKAGNNITLGAGAHDVTLGGVSGYNAANRVKINLGTEADAQQKLTLLGAASNMEYKGSKGIDTLLFQSAVSGSDIDMGTGTNELNAYTLNSKGAKVGQRISNTNIAAAGQTTIYGGAFAGGKAGNNITLGAGAHDVTLGGVSGYSYANRVKINLGTEADVEQKLTLLGAANNMEYTGSKGTDKLVFQGAVSNSDIDMGTGTNELNAYKLNSKGAKVGQRISNTNITAEGQTTIYGGVFAGGKAGSNITLGAGKHDVTLGGVSGYNSANRAKINLGTEADVEQTLTSSAQRVTWSIQAPRASTM